MTEKESKKLKVGDAVTFVSETGKLTPGVVTETGYGCNKIAWDDGVVSIIAHVDADFISHPWGRVQ